MPPPPVAATIQVVPARIKNGNGWKAVALVSILLFLCSLFVNPVHLFLNLMEGGGGLAMHESGGPRLQEVVVQRAKGRNRVLVVPIEGVIMSQKAGRGFSMVDVVAEQLRIAGEDEHVRAVILRVNSPGGEVLASDEIYKLIQSFHERTGKPVVAAMESVAASGGYYVAAPCQWIVANELTITGSIGVIMHGYNFRGLMDKVGVRPETFKSGRFKDMLSPDKREEDISAEEREMIQSMVNETFDKFKSIVAEGRGNALKKSRNSTASNRALVDNWQQYADGRVLSGKEALKLGFVDELGNLGVALSRALKLAKIDDATVVEYRPLFDLTDLFGFLGQSGEARTVKVDLGLDTPRLQLGHMYFLYPLALPR